MKELENRGELMNGDVILELYSPTCIPCKKQAKILASLEESGSLSNVIFIKCDATTDLGTELCEQFNLMSAPTTLCFRNSEIISKFTKLTMPQEFEAIYNKEG